MLCTGNLHRSPMAEALLRRELERREAPATVSSAGLVTEGRPPAREVLELMRDRGIDVSGFRSRKIDPGLLAGPDLVLGMAREHVREVVVTEPSLLGRTFTLKELVRRASAAGPRPFEEPFADWVERVRGDRTPQDLLGSSDADDVADPIGQRFSVFERTAAEIEELVRALADLAFGPPVR